MPCIHLHPLIYHIYIYVCICICICILCINVNDTHHIYIYTSDYTRSPVGEVPRLAAEMSFVIFQNAEKLFLPF